MWTRVANMFREKRVQQMMAARSKYWNTKTGSPPQPPVKKKTKTSVSRVQSGKSRRP